MAKVIAMMDQEGVYWQIGELGAVDVAAAERLPSMWLI